MNVPIFDPNTGMNYTSPTVASMGGMGQSIPPYPMGMVNVGGMGYNQQGITPPFSGGYIVPQQQYNPYYGGYSYYGQSPDYRHINPYLYQKQVQAQQAAYKEQTRQQADIMKSIARNCMIATGQDKIYPDMDAQLDRIYNPFPELSEDQKILQEEIQRYNTLMTRPTNVVNPIVVRANQAQAVSYQYKNKYPDDMGLVDFLSKAGEMYIDKINADIKKAELDGKLQYDTDQYKRLLNAHQETSQYFNSILTGNAKNIQIDDMEIQLPTQLGERPSIVTHTPDHIARYAETKQRFLDCILRKMG